MRALALLGLLGACHRHPAPPKPAGPASTVLALHVTDHGQPVAARVLLFGADGQALHIGTLDLYDQRQGATACEIAPGVLGSWDGLILANGTAEVPVGADTCDPSPAIPFGAYKVWAWRGIEYELWQGTVDLTAGRGKVELAIPLERAFTPQGTLAADLHVHAHASNDSTVPNPQRVIAQVAAGIQVIGLSDHNVNGDLNDEIHALHLDNTVVSVPANELTSDQFHLGIYPVKVERNKERGGSPSDDEIVPLETEDMFKAAHKFSGSPIIQVNHPRFRATALFDYTNWDGVAWPPPFPLSFDAIEVLAGYSAANLKADRRIDESVRDYYTFLDHGHIYAPLGNSDTHDLNWVLDGTARNYVYADDPRVKPFDQAGFIAAIRAHRVVATTGPWLDVEVASDQASRATVGPGQSLVAKTGSVWLDVTVQRAKFVHVDRIRVVVGTPDGPRLVRSLWVPPTQTQYHWSGDIKVGDKDTWLVVTADSDDPMPLEITGTYQRDRWNHPGVTPFAIAAPILIDADGDGRWKRGDADLPLVMR